MSNAGQDNAAIQTDRENEPQGLLALAGLFRDDPDLEEICNQIYRDRDAEKAAYRESLDRNG